MQTPRMQILRLLPSTNINNHALPKINRVSQKQERGFLMRFNLDRFLGVLAIGTAAFFLVLMQHEEPMSFFYRLQREPNNVLIWWYAGLLIIAAVFLST